MAATGFVSTPERQTTGSRLPLEFIAKGVWAPPVNCKVGKACTPETPFTGV